MSGAQKGARKAPAGAVHVDVDVETGVLLQLVERLGELEHRLVRPGVGDAEGRHHHDGVLVHPLEHLLDVHAVAPRRHRDLPHLDVPVPGELVPDHLHGPAHHVGLVGRLPRGLCAWPASATWPPYRRACSASEDPMAEQPTGSAASGAFHRPGQHADAAPLQLGRLGILVLVDEVLVDAQVHQADGPPAPPRSGRTWPGSGVRCRRAGARRRSPASRRRAASRRWDSASPAVSPSAWVGVDRIDQLIPEALPLVQRHDAAPWARSLVGAVPYRSVEPPATSGSTQVHPGPAGSEPRRARRAAADGVSSRGSCR